MNESARLLAVYYAQDDPKKNTIIKLKKFHLIKVLKNLRDLNRRAIILDPFSEKVVSMDDRLLIQKFGLAVIDCSWKKAKFIFNKNFKTGRKLPPLLAANSVNYGKWNKLSSVEALAAALILTGFEKQAEEILSKFVWGSTFLKLNENLFAEYLEKNGAERGI